MSSVAEPDAVGCVPPPRAPWPVGGPALPVACALLVGATLVSLASGASADPRWWWDDAPILPAGPERSGPSVAVVDGEAAFDFLVGWSEVDAGGGGDLEAWLTATPDQGCTWCPPIRLTDDGAEARRVRVAATVGRPGGAAEGRLLVQVAFDRSGAGTVVWGDMPASPADPCGALKEMESAIEARGDARTTRLGGRAPDIAARDGEFHAAWTEAFAASGPVFHRRDPTGLGGEGWGPAVAVASEDGAFFEDASLALDANAEVGLAINVAFRNGTELHHRRSVDGGVTWEVVGAPEGVITPTEAKAFGRPEITASPSGLWVAAAWPDAREPAAPVAQVNAMALRGPLEPSLPWLFEQRMGTAEADEPVVDVVLGSDEDDTTPATVTWDDGGEVFARHGMLTEMAGFPVNWFSSTFPVVRSGEPSVAGTHQLTACAFDPADWSCVPARAAGSATRPSAAGEAGPDGVMLLAWRDDREGIGNVWFKRTDAVSPRQEAPGLVAGCDGMGSRSITVRWTATLDCGAVSERLARFLVYHGPDPGGPYDNAATPVVVPHEPGETEHVVVLEGLPAGEQRWVVVVAEDEARNVVPPAFNPFRDNAPLDNEASVLTPVECGACLYRATLGTLDAEVSEVLVTPRLPSDLAIDAPAIACDVGPEVRDPAAAADGAALHLYQVDRSESVLRVRRDGPDVVVTR